MSQVVILHDDAVAIDQERQDQKGWDALVLMSYMISREDVKKFLREVREWSKAEEHKIISRHLWPCILVEAGLSQDVGRSSPSADINVIVPVTDREGNQVILTKYKQDLMVKIIPSPGLTLDTGPLGSSIIAAVPEGTRAGLRVEFDLEEDGIGLTLLFGEGADAYAPQGLSRIVSVSMREGHITAKIGDLGFEEAFLLVARHPDEEGFVLYFASQAQIIGWTP